MSLTTGATLRRDAEHLVGGLPPLLAEANRLASSVILGVHGRRRTGMGENFWQYRQAMPGDDLATVDWRRSGRTDAVFIREREWEAAHTVAIWCDPARSMHFSSHKSLDTKFHRAAVMSLALSVLLSKAGERIAFPATAVGEARTGERHLQRIAATLSSIAPDEEYGEVPKFDQLNAARTVFFSDFLGPEDKVLAPLRTAAERAGVGSIVQILDPTEISFPFDGRVIFESMGGAIEFETLRAKALREEYQERLEKRKDLLTQFARDTGWRFVQHQTSQSPTQLLLWLYMAIGVV